MNSDSETLETFEHVTGDDAADTALRQQLLDLWVDATNAGGAIGFVAPVSANDVAPVLDDALGRVVAGTDDLGVLLDPDGRAVAMGFLVSNPSSALTGHWRTVLRVAVHPSEQGRGLGLRLMAHLHDLGRAIGLHHLVLSVRSGHSLEPFYERAGYRIFGTHPGSVRVTDDDLRDEIWLLAEL